MEEVTCRALCLCINTPHGEVIQKGLIAFCRGIMRRGEGGRRGGEQILYHYTFSADAVKFPEESNVPTVVLVTLSSLAHSGRGELFHFCCCACCCWGSAFAGGGSLSLPQARGGGCLPVSSMYHRMVYNYEYLLIANCKFFLHLRFANINMHENRPTIHNNITM